MCSFHSRISIQVQFVRDSHCLPTAALIRAFSLVDRRHSSRNSNKTRELAKPPLADLQATIVEGAAKRLRPKFMTVATMFVGLIPIMWATGAESDVWKRIAAPMVGGILTSFVIELVVYPAIYEIWKWHFEMKRAYAEPASAALPSLEATEQIFDQVQDCARPA
jgi:AcrB/AcrD/AcrF family